MGWKEYPYWLKGGIIGLIIPLISIVYEIVDSIFGNSYINNASLAIYSILIFILAIICFVIGSIIGLIINKVKK